MTWSFGLDAGPLRVSGDLSALTTIECLIGLGTPSGALAALLQRRQLTDKEMGSFRGQLEGIWALIGAQDPPTRWPVKPSSPRWTEPQERSRIQSATRGQTWSGADLPRTKSKCPQCTAWR